MPAPGAKPPGGARCLTTRPSPDPTVVRAPRRAAAPKPATAWTPPGVRDHGGRRRKGDVDLQRGNRCDGANAQDGAEHVPPRAGPAEAHEIACRQDVPAKRRRACGVVAHHRQAGAGDTQGREGAKAENQHRRQGDQRERAGAGHRAGVSILPVPRMTLASAFISQSRALPAKTTPESISAVSSAAPRPPSAPVDGAPEDQHDDGDGRRQSDDGVKHRVSLRIRKSLVRATNKACPRLVVCAWKRVPNICTGPKQRLR